MVYHDKNLANLDLRFKTPGTCLISGASNSGKSTFMRELLVRRKFFYDRPPGKVYWFYRIYQDALFDEMLETKVVDEFHQGMVTMDWIKENISVPNSTIVIDDLTTEIDQDTSNIFTVGSHHLDVNVFLICQNLFTKNPYFRDISINVTATVVFKFPRDSSSIVNLAKQLAPGRTKDIVKIYKEATKRPYSYVYFDYHQATDDDLRIRSNLFNEHGEPMRIYKLN